MQHIYSTAKVSAYQITRAFFTKNVWILLKAVITYVRQTKDYKLNDWKLLVYILRHSIICVHKVVYSVPLLFLVAYSFWLFASLLLEKGT